MHTPGEVAWFLDWLRKTYKSAPKRQWRWAAASASWNFDEIVAGKRREATTDGPEIWKAIYEHEASGRWPKLSGRAAHFLRERLLAGIVLCESWLRSHSPSGSAVAPVRPSDPEAIGRRVLLEHWDTKGVEYWLEENKAEFQERAEDDYY
jgi:hypothetical protein